MAPHRAARDRGFTLVELLVVVIIVGVLAAIAIPVFLKQREKATKASLASDRRNAATVLQEMSLDPTQPLNAIGASRRAGDGTLRCYAVGHSLYTPSDDCAPLVGELGLKLSPGNRLGYLGLNSTRPTGYYMCIENPGIGWAYDMERYIFPSDGTVEDYSWEWEGRC